MRVDARHQAQLHAVKGEATGGDSYPHAELYTTGNGSFELIIARNGDYTLYDVNVKVRDQNKVEALPLPKMFRENPQNALATIESADRKFTLGNIGTNGGGNQSFIYKMLDLKIPQNVEAFSFVLNMSARNGSWYQQIGAKKIKGEWKIGSMLTGNYVKENHPQLSAGFPLTPKGDPDFEAEPRSPRPPAN